MAAINTVALVDTGGTVVRCGSVVGTHKARELTLVRLISASLTVLTDFRHDVEECTCRAGHYTAPHRSTA